MPKTLADMPVTFEWQSMNTFFSFAIGAEFGFQVKSGGSVLVAQGNEPAAGSSDGPVFSNANGITMIAADGPEVWVKVYFNDAHQKIAAWQT